MITIKRLEVALKTTTHTAHPKDCYAIIDCCQSQYYCRVVTCTDSKLIWTFQAETVRLPLNCRQFSLKLHILEYNTCKAIHNLQLQFNDANISSKRTSMAKQLDSKYGQIEVVVQYVCERVVETKKVQQMKNFDGVSKKTSTTHHEENSLLASGVQKVVSSKLVPTRETDFYNFGPYYSPKKAADLYLKAYRQSKETHLYQSLSLRKIGSYKLLI